MTHTHSRWSATSCATPGGTTSSRGDRTGPDPPRLLAVSRPRHRLFEAGNPYREVVGDYYRLLDDKVGELLELLDEETVILVVSDHGAKPLDGGFCINEWLIRQGWLVLNGYPGEATPFGQLASTGTDPGLERGGLLREGLSERQGPGAPRNHRPGGLPLLPRRGGRQAGSHPGRPGPSHGHPGLQARTGLSLGPQGGPRPHRPLRGTRLALHRIGGPAALHLQENDTGPDGCNHAQHGAFILNAPGLSRRGQVQGAHLLDMAPTLLRLGGYDLPASMQGTALFS